MVMLKWIFWIIVVWWLLSKLADTKKNNRTNEYNADDKSSFKPQTPNKHLKKDAGDYVDYEEIN